MPSPNEPLQYIFSYQDAVDVLRLVRESASVSSFEFELGDIKLSIVRERGVARPAALPAPEAETSTSIDPPRAARNEAATSAPPREASAKGSPLAADQAIVIAPMLGIFYRSASPGEAPFVREGDVVKMGDVIGLIEVMKLFTQVTADCAGRIVRIEAGDQALVEHGETLMVIERSNDA